MAYGFKVVIRGDRACFSRPELKVERVSYEVITPSAARGILEAIAWKPAIKYVIDEIAVCAPIRFENIRRNEVGFKASSMEPRFATDDRQQRAALILKDVCYVVTAHFDMTDKAGIADNESKFAEVIRRRIVKGRSFHTPYLGTREFPALVSLIEGEDAAPTPIDETRTLGLMLYDIEYVIENAGNDAEFVKEFKPTFFVAEMKKGIIDLRNVKVLR